MRKIEFGLLQAPVLFAGLLIGCGDKANDDALMGDTAEMDADGATDVDGTVDDGADSDMDGSPDADGGTGGDSDGGPDTGDDTGSDDDSDGGDADGTDTGDDTGSGDADGTGPSGPTIKDMQNGLYEAGELVTLESVVVSSPPTARGTGFYIADLSGGEQSGLWVYNDWLDDDEEIALNVGDLIDITGVVSEYPTADGPLPDTETLTQMRVTTSSDIRIDEMTASVPAPAAASTTLLSDPVSAEPWESVLVSVDDVVISTTAEGDLSIGDGVLLSDAFIDELRSGDRLSRIVGIVEYSAGQFRLAPRTNVDFLGLVTLGSTGSCSSTKCAADLVVGDIAITEVMNNPNSYCGGGHAGEYIEVYNNSGAEIDLAGVSISDLSRSTYIDGSFVVAAGEYALLERGDSPCVASGGIAYSAAMYSSVRLTDSGDAAVVLSYADADLDRVEMLGEGEGAIEEWPSSDGVSMQLNASGDASTWHTANDSKANWCPAVSAIDGSSGDSGLGTPGSASVCAL